MHSIEAVGLNQKQVSCPACHGYHLESQWCGICEQKGCIYQDNSLNKVFDATALKQQVGR